MLIKDLTETMHRKSKEIIEIYEDADQSFKNENDICAGNVAPNVWDNFYAKLGEIDVSSS